MTESRLPPERIELGKADDPRDVVHQVVAALAQGEVVALSSSGEPGFAASALHIEGVSQLGPGPATLLLKSSAELADWVEPSALISRLARRVWPGLVTLSFSVPDHGGLLQRLSPVLRPRLTLDNALSLQVPAEEFVRDVLDLLPGPVVFRKRVESEDVGTRARLLIDPGPGSSQSATVVRIGEDGTSWSIASAGAVAEATITRLAGTIILFICTGNTCRSPMAEALCKVRLAERLRCKIAELEDRGFVVVSAGIAASNGMPAAGNAMTVVQLRGGSLANHQSRKLSTELVWLADYIFGMTADHIEALLDHIPEAAPKVRVLHPLGDDLTDPIGTDRETYQRTADTIEESLQHWLDALGF